MHVRSFSILNEAKNLINFTGGLFKSRSERYMYVKYEQEYLAS